MSAELLAFRSLNRSLDEFAEGMAILFQRLGVGVDLVAAASKLVPHSAGPQAVPASKVPTTFVLKIISDGFLCPVNNLDCEDRGIRWKDFALLASDGNTLHLTSIPFPSVERSKKQFDLTIKSAEKIVRRNVESNSKGEQVGERALGLFPKIKDSKPPSGVPHYKLFWMWGPNYWEITGEHLDDVLALEQRLKEEGTNAVWGWGAKIPSTPD